MRWGLRYWQLTSTNLVRIAQETPWNHQSIDRCEDSKSTTAVKCDDSGVSTTKNVVVTGMTYSRCLATQGMACKDHFKMCFTKIDTLSLLSLISCFTWWHIKIPCTLSPNPHTSSGSGVDGWRQCIWYWSSSLARWLTAAHHVGASCGWILLLHVGPGIIPLVLQLWGCMFGKQTGILQVNHHSNTSISVAIWRATLTTYSYNSSIFII